METIFANIIMLFIFLLLSVITGIGIIVWTRINLATYKQKNMQSHIKISDSQNEFEEDADKLAKAQKINSERMVHMEEELVDIRKDMHTLQKNTNVSLQAMNDAFKDPHGDDNDIITFRKTVNDKIEKASQHIDQVNIDASRLQEHLFRVHEEMKIDNDTNTGNMEAIKSNMIMINDSVSVVKNAMGEMSAQMNKARHVINNLEQYDFDMLYASRDYASVNFNETMLQKTASIENAYVPNSDMPKLQNEYNELLKQQLDKQIETLEKETISKTNADPQLLDSLRTSLNTLLKTISTHIETLNNLPLLQEFRAMLASVPSYKSIESAMNVLENKSPVNVALHNVPFIGPELTKNNNNLDLYRRGVIDHESDPKKLHVPKELCIEKAGCLTGDRLQALKAQYILSPKMYTMGLLSPDEVISGKSSPLQGEYLDQCTDCVWNSTTDTVQCVSCLNKGGTSMTSNPSIFVNNWACKVAVNNSGSLICS